MATEPLNEDEQKKASEVIRDLRVALSNFFLYEPENTMVRQSLDRFLQDLTEFLAARTQVTLGESEGQLLIEGTPVDTRFTGSTASILDLFHGHQLHSITFLQGIESGELVRLLQMIRPKALAPGEILTDVLKRENLPHVQVNQKVFVAVKEGEKLISTEGFGDEENVEEALQSLRSFLGVFSRVKPDGKKREILGELQTQLGPVSTWGGEGGTGPAKEGGTGSGQGGGAGWGELVAGLMGLKQALQNLQAPQDSKKAQDSVEVLLQKLVLLLESQGMMDPGVRKELGAGTDEEQESLFDQGSVLQEWRRGDIVSILDPAQEEIVAKNLEELNENPEAPVVQTAWKLLWAGALDETEETAGLALRHLARIRRGIVPREQQVEGLKLLGGLLEGTASPGRLKEAAALTAHWWDDELEEPDWLETARLLKRWKKIAGSSSPEQASLAQETLKHLFTPETVHSLLESAITDPQAGGPATVVLSIAGPGVGDQLMERILKAAPSDPSRDRMLDLLYGMQSEGLEVIEDWFKTHDAGPLMGAFLRILERVPLPPSLAPDFEARWATFPSEIKKKTMELAARWECRTFRPIVLGTLLDPAMDLVRHALKILPKIHLQGDSLKVLEAVETRPYGHKDEKELFTITVCRTLGEMADPMSLTTLMEWSQSYGLLERRREKSLTIRMAAVEALGNFRSHQVESFLEKLVQKEEKDLKQVATESLKQVREKLAGSAASIEGFQEFEQPAEHQAPPPAPPSSPLSPESPPKDDDSRGLLE